MSTALDQLTERLRTRLAAGAPGFEAQRLMAPDHRRPATDYLKEEKNVRIAAVMAVLFADERDAVRLLLMQRTDAGDVHSNQVSFPGGKAEPDDAHLMATAIRETEEEVGVKLHETQVLGALSPLYIPPSRFLVHPFVAVLPEVPSFNTSEHEVKQILTPELSLFLNPDNIGKDVFGSARGYAVEAPYYHIEGLKIWGATAMMIAELVELVKA